MGVHGGSAGDIIRAGDDYVIVGRSIYQSDDPADTMRPCGTIKAAASPLTTTSGRAEWDGQPGGVVGRVAERRESQRMYALLKVNKS